MTTQKEPNGQTTLDGKPEIVHVTGTDNGLEIRFFEKIGFLNCARNPIF
jgi:hypothetical protein